MHVNVCRDFLILRYFTNTIVVCPSKCQNFFLEDMDGALQFFVLMGPKSTSLLFTLCALQVREKCYSSVKSNQNNKCQISLLWSLHCFWAANHFNKLQKVRHCAKKRGKIRKSSFLRYFIGVQMKQSLQESYYQPCPHPAPAHALYRLPKEEGKQGGDPLRWDFLHHKFRSQRCFYSRASEKGEVNPAVAIVRRTRSQSGTDVPRGCEYRAGTFFRKSSRKAAWKPEQNRPISI